MVSLDSNSGNAVRVSGAALAAGPAILLGRSRRLDDVVRGIAGGSFSGLLRQTQALKPERAGEPPTPRPEALPAQWAIPAYYGGAPYGPPYELLNRTAEWELSGETRRAFRTVSEQARMALRVHPLGPALQSPGPFLTALYQSAPTPRSLGVGLDTRV